MHSRPTLGNLISYTPVKSMNRGDFEINTPFGAKQLIKTVTNLNHGTFVCRLAISWNKTLANQSSANLISGVIFAEDFI